MPEDMNPGPLKYIAGAFPTPPRRKASQPAKFHLVDPARSEAFAHTKVSDQMQKGKQINTDDLHLQKVISALAKQDSKEVVCYRNSQLTRLLKNSLGGNSITLMIACVSPSHRFMKETVRTLEWANSAKNIEIKPVAYEDPQDKEIADLKQQIQDLREKLTTAETKTTILTGRLREAEMVNRRLKEEHREATSSHFQAYLEISAKYKGLQEDMDNMQLQAKKFHAER